MEFEKDVVIIGTGRVGLPLALSLSSVGFDVIGVDKNDELREMVNRGKMPFAETGCDELIKQCPIKIYGDMGKVKEAENVVITVGTPLSAHIETDLSQVRNVLQEIIPYIRHGHNIILRSTIAPRTMVFVKRYLEKMTEYKVGRDIYLSFCPERLAEGKALKELRELPQIVGSEDEASGKKAEALFGRLTTDILHTDFISAELVKLFNNTSRYIQFAMANQFAILADEYGGNIYNIIEMTNYKYPRGVIKQPGFTAGTCLRKDFGMINENNPYSDLLLTSWKINEYLPKFLVEGILRRECVNGKNVAILGYTFKRDADDTRDSLVPKLIRYIEREVPNDIKVHEPFLGALIEDKYHNHSLEDSLRDADIVFIATNHSRFEDGFDYIEQCCKEGCWIVDIWNVGHKNNAFYQK